MPSRNPRIEVLILDDHRMFADALRLALSAQKGIDVTAVASSVDEAEARARERPPAVALVDLDVPGQDAALAIRRVREAAPEARVLALTTDQGEVTVAQAVEAGAAGHLSK